jgi:quercetin dioxygenase-like cupin family protein
MRVSARDLKAVRAGGLVSRYAILGDAVFVIADVPEGGTAGTALETPCRQEHWGLVLQGSLHLDARRPRDFGPGTAFYVPPDRVHRFTADGRAVVAGFAPVTSPVDDSPDALRERGIEVLRHVSVPDLPPTSIRVEGSRTRTAATGRIHTVSAVMGSWLFTRSVFGSLSGFAEGWCDLPHWGLVLEGDLVLHWENGELELLGPGDAFHCPSGPPGHRIEVADVATIVDYTPIAAIDEPERRRAPRALAARTGRVRGGDAGPSPAPNGKHGKVRAGAG